MSFSCTLHPVDPRILRELSQSLKGEKADWEFLIRLWRQKQGINRVNQPFKEQVAASLTEIKGLVPELHLWGRPFFIHSNEPAAINAAIARLYGLNNEAERVAFFQAQLRCFAADSELQKVRIKPRGDKRYELGLNRVLDQLRALYKKKSFKELGMDLGFVAAQLAGAGYPYWHLDVYTLSFLHDLQAMSGAVEPVGLPGVFRELEAVAPLIPVRLERNLSAGIYLNPAEVEVWAGVLKTEESAILGRLAQKQVTRPLALLLLQKIREALEYAREYRYGILEASDIYEEKPPPYP